MLVRGKDFEGDGTVVALSLQQSNGPSYIHAAGAKRKVKVRGTSLVVVQVHVPEPRSVRGEQLLDCALPNHQIRVTDIQMQTQLGQRIEQLAQLCRGVEVAGQILQHQTDAPMRRVGKQLGQSLQILLHKERARVHWGMAVGMDVHPAGANSSKHVHAAPQLLQRCPADFLDSTGDGQVIRGVAHDAEPVALERLPYGLTVDSPRSRHRRFQGEVDKSQAERCHPLDLL
jgi:hypothetical protein